MRQRLGIAQALIGDPQLLVFDEPTSGLDPASRHDVYDMIDALRTSGATVLLSTHALVEVEERVDRVAILDRGTLRAAGTLRELRSESGAKARIVVRTRPCCTGQVLAALPSCATCSERSDTGLTLEVRPQDKVAVLRAVLSTGDVVEDIEVHTAGLQELYRDLVDEPDDQ
jgi:Cu-processing system ATP-binding protein